MKVLNYLRECDYFDDLSIFFSWQLYVPIHPIQTKGILTKKSFLELDSFSLFSI